MFNVVGGPDLTMTEIDEAASIIAKSVDPDADIIFGAVIDEKMMDQIKVTIIATKFDDNRIRLFHFKKESSDELPRKSGAKDSDSKQSTESLKEDDIDEKEYFDDETEFDIPAFLRKK